MTLEEWLAGQPAKAIAARIRQYFERAQCDLFLRPFRLAAPSRLIPDFAQPYHLRLRTPGVVKFLAYKLRGAR